jgi:hypothetical protein
VSAVDDILSQIPMGQLASQLGVDEGTAEQATRQALPALLGGMEANAQDPRGAASLAEALGQHSPALAAGGVDLEEVDPNDGDRIVGHVFGDKRGHVVDTLGAVGGTGGGNLIGKLLPLLAPIVMSYLAGRLGNRSGGVVAQDGGGIGDILGGLLGGGAGGGGGIGEILGGLLGGGRR